MVAGSSELGSGGVAGAADCAGMLARACPAVVCAVAVAEEDSEAGEERAFSQTMGTAAPAVSRAAAPAVT